jgi:hypothetical protein
VKVHLLIWILMKIRFLKKVELNKNKIIQKYNRRLMFK